MYEYHMWYHNFDIQQVCDEQNPEYIVDNPYCKHHYVMQNILVLSKKTDCFNLLEDPVIQVGVISPKIHYQTAGFDFECSMFSFVSCLHDLGV